MSLIRKTRWAAAALSLPLALVVGCGVETTTTEPAPSPTPAVTPSAPIEPQKGPEPKVETPKAEAPKTETPKAEPPKVETPKVEAPKVEAPKVEPPKVEPPKGEAEKKADAAAKLTEEELAEIKKLPAGEIDAALKQVVCPASGEHLGAMGTPIKVSAEGKSFYICCKGCEKEVKENPKDILAKLAK
ncbi:MAG: TRASH domain-containing protein [Isosphaeraceae bacterium]